MIITQYIPDIISDVVAKVATVLGTPVYYEFGSDPMVTQNLTEKDGSITMKDKKYPLVWLVVPFEEIHGTRIDMYAEVKCDICIVTDTRADYKMTDRAAINFKPILYPIYAELINQLSVSKKFANSYVGSMSYVKTDYPYWGKNNANLFNDFIDAIQLKNLKLTVRNSC